MRPNLLFMKKIICLLTLGLSLSTIAFAQDTKTETVTETSKSSIVKPSRDFLMFQITYDNWAQTPDNVKIGGIGRGFNIYLAYDFPLKKSNFSFAAGIGISTSNIYFNNQVAVLNSSSESIVFNNVDTTVIGGKRDNFYKKSKLSTAYVEAPFELRFFGNKINRNRGFKAAIGMKVGLLVGAHSKVRESLYGPVITEKVNSTNYLQSWRFTPNARIGWGNFALSASYSISSLFKAGSGPVVYPYSIGLTITGL